LFFQREVAGDIEIPAECSHQGEVALDKFARRFILRQLDGDVYATHVFALSAGSLPKAVIIGTTRVKAYAANKAAGEFFFTSRAGSALNLVASGRSTPYSPVRVAPNSSSRSCAFPCAQRSI